MKKLALRIDELKVESFTVVRETESRGTVQAHILETRHGNTCVTQCATGPCDCMITPNFSCDMPCGSDPC